MGLSSSSFLHSSCSRIGLPRPEPVSTAENPRPEASPNFLLALAIHVVIYLAGVLAAMNFFDATTVLDDRMLLPVYWITLLFMLVGVDHLRRTMKTRPVGDCWRGGMPWPLGFALVGSIITVRN